MKCYEVKDGKIIAGLPLVKPTRGPAYVLCGHEVCYRSLFNSVTEEIGIKVVVTESLAATYTLATERVMEAELLRNDDGSYALDITRGKEGVLVLYAVKPGPTVDFVFRPTAPARNHIEYVSELSGAYYSERWPFILSTLLAGESMSAFFRWQKLRPGTGPSLFHPFRKEIYDWCIDPREEVHYDGINVTIAQAHSYSSNKEGGEK